MPGVMNGARISIAREITGPPDVTAGLLPVI